MNYVELYPGDYMRDTADLSLIEHGAYLLLLLHYYATELPIPSDNRTLFRIARAMTEEEQSAVTRVADRFFPVDPSDGMRHSTRADREITKAIDRIEKARANGKRGGRPKKPDQNPTLSDPVNRNETGPLTGMQTGMKAHHTPHAIKEQEQDQQRPPAAAFDPLRDMIDGGVAYLAECGVSDKQARSVIGMLRKAVGDDLVVAELLAVAQRDRVADPVAWLRKAADTRKKSAGSTGSKPWDGAL